MTLNTSVTSLTVLSLLVILASNCVYGRVSGISTAMLRSYFGCRKCDLSDCPTLPIVEEGCIPIKESGACGCCMECARLEHEACGVYTPQCAPGLQCRASDNLVDTEGQLYSLMKSQGSCTKVDIQLPATFVPAFGKIKQRRRYWKTLPIDF